MAAAAANSEILEDISKVLQMLEEEITKIHKLCLLRRREIDCCIQQCRPLLKPWPLKSDKSEETSENTAKSSMIHQSESTVVQGTEITDNEAKEAERQDLAALDGLLAKAQKAREIQTKIDEAAAKANQKKVSSKKPIPVTTAHAKEPPLHATKESLSSKPSKPAASKKPSAAGKSAAQRQVLKSTYSSSYGRRPSSAKSLIRPAKSQSSTNVYLDSVIGRNAKEGKQTINDSKHQGSIASSSKRNLTSAGGVNDDSKRHDTVVSLPEVKDGSSSATRLNARACNAQSIEIRHCHGLDVPDENVHSSSLTERDHKPGSVTRKSPESVFALRKGDCLPNSDQADKQEMFDPFGEGAELKLPIKYRRLKATTAKLYSELENFSEKRESPLPSQQFVQGIESLFDMGDIPTHSELQDKGIALLKEHEKLSKLTSNVVNRSQNLDDDSPWPEVYKCYRLWQIVLNKFNELQKGTQQLLEGVRNQRKILLHCLLGGSVCCVYWTVIWSYHSWTGRYVRSFNFIRVSVEHQAVLLSKNFLYSSRTVV
ncbi:uncharacterized protein [Montipora foliosa]|uniref:uncharacterized protein isoform X1 n=2 Tax=Montipora foliosa TaxID=591990 RepID=UPI0035F18592